MVHIVQKNKCSGCSACSNICPQKCIKMLPDEEGFLYPVVDKDQCMDCGKCDIVCPVQEPVPISDSVITTYAVRSKDIKNLMASTSGGFFLPLAEWVTKNDGKVFAATFDKDYQVIHKEVVVDARGDRCSQVRGSKYVQSSVEGSFKYIKDFLARDIQICFIGTPCQVQGLKKLVGVDNPNLITVDLVCHGVPSPKLWRKYVEYQIKKHHSDILDIKFRGKKYGYHSGGFMEIVFKNGKKYCASARTDYMLKSFFKEISSRPICYECPFKTLNRCSDLTLYDCWHFQELVPHVKDDDRGYTNVIIQSKKGADIFSKLKEKIEFYEVDTQKTKKLDGIMIDSCTIPHKNRENFYNALEHVGIEKTINKYIPISLIDHFVEVVKKGLYRAYLMQYFKRAILR